MELGGGGLWHGVISLGQMETGRIMMLAEPWFLVPLSPGWMPLGPGIGTLVVVLHVRLGVSVLLVQQVIYRHD